MPLDGASPASAAQLLTPAQLGGFSVQSKKRNRHIYGKTQLILKQRRDLALGKHASVGAYVLSSDATQLPKRRPLPRMQQLILSGP